MSWKETEYMYEDGGGGVYPVTSCSRDKDAGNMRQCLGSSRVSPRNIEIVTMKLLKPLIYV